MESREELKTSSSNFSFRSRGAVNKGQKGDDIRNKGLCVWACMGV